MRKNMKKAITAMTLATAMSTTMFSSAFAQDVAAADNVPVINLVIPSMGSTAGYEQVEEAMNEILVPEVGAKVKLTYIDFGAYTQQTNLMLTGSDDIDIFFIIGSPASYISNGQLLDITDYWDASGDNLKNLIDDFVMDADLFSGRLYTIPCIIERSHEFCLEVNKEMLEGMGLSNDDEEKIWTLDEIHDLLVQAHETYSDAYTLVPQNANRNVEGYSWDGLGDTNFIGVVEDYGTTGKVVSITECQDFIDLAHTFRDWYNEGLIMQDILSYTEYGGNLVQNGQAFSHFEYGCQPSGMSVNRKITPLTIVPNWVDSTCSTRFSYGINGNTKNPDAAYAVLEQLYTNDEIIKLYSFGIEGVHYTINEDGKADNFPDDTPFGIEWATPATRACSLTPFDYAFDNHAATDKAYDDDAFAAGRVSKCIGANFDSTAVSDAYTACVSVREKYFNAILSGAVDPDENIAAFAEELKASGEDIVIAEKQRLLDELDAQ